MKFIIALTGALVSLSFIHAAADVRCLEDHCAYIVDRNGDALTYKQALDRTLEHLSELDSITKTTIQTGISFFTHPASDEIDFHGIDYENLKTSIEKLKALLTEKNPYLALFRFKHSSQADEDLKSYSEEYLIGYSIFYGLGTIGSNAWKYKQKQKNVGKWH
jgi:hypothetical protein